MAAARGRRGRGGDGGAARAQVLRAGRVHFGLLVDGQLRVHEAEGCGSGEGAGLTGALAANRPARGSRSHAPRSH
jgi:hypothetical protein